ncbi:FIG00932595: hypothetical protein [Polaromonas sp. CG9_12]|nr:FIG00932595: hypothetical protein [Polaromonas sp. CG9_12]
MYLLMIGVLGLVLKYLQTEPVAGWSWWLVFSPFALAAVWWAWADASGYTKRKEIEKMDYRKKKRIDRQRTALGLTSEKRL